MQIKDSMECAKSELDLFSVPPTNTAIEEGHWDNIQPHPNFDQSPVIRFDITGTNAHYIDLAATELHVKFTIIDNRTSKLAPHKDLALVNNFLHSMFEQCQVYLNNVAVENTNKCYAYRAYLENLLCYNNDAKENLLRGDFFFPESKLKQGICLQRQKNMQQLLMKLLLNMKHMEKFIVIYLILISTC